MKIAIIGDRDTVLAFNLLGIDNYSLEIDDDIEDKIKKIIDELAVKKYALVFITEQYYTYAEKSIEHYKNELLPIINVIPSNKENLNIGMNKISENMEKAIGTNIF